MRIRITEVLLDHLAGAEIYPQSIYFSHNPIEIRDHAIEDAEFILAINFDGYEDYPQPITVNAVRSFTQKAKIGE